jgi:hypothetical protein
MSLRATILQAIETALSTATGAPIYRTRRDPIPENKLPAIVIEPDREPNSQQVIGRVDAALTVAISVLFTGAVTDTPNDLLISQIQQLLESGINAGTPDDGVLIGPDHDIEFTDDSIDLGRATFRVAAIYVRPVGDA